MFLKIKVKPNSLEQSIEKLSDNEYKISLKEKAEKDKANIELLKLLKKHFGRGAKIIKGLKSRNKVVELA